jgi:hypothetical protein
MSGPTLPPAPPMAWQVMHPSSFAAINLFAAQGVAAGNVVGDGVDFFVRNFDIGSQAARAIERQHEVGLVAAAFARDTHSRFATVSGRFSLARPRGERRRGVLYVQYARQSASASSSLVTSFNTPTICGIEARC